MKMYHLPEAHLNINNKVSTIYFLRGENLHMDIEVIFNKDINLGTKIDEFLINLLVESTIDRKVEFDKKDSNRGGTDTKDA